MTEHESMYEPPVLVEVGNFSELTLGLVPGFSPDFIWRFYNLCPNGC